MISFYNQKFHEKILKKYSRIIRKSYFPNLFFKQDCKSSDPRMGQIFSYIKFDFYNILFWKNFPLNSPKEKIDRYPLLTPKIKNAYLKLYASTYEKSISLNFKSGRHELQNLTYRLINLGLPSRSSTFSEPILHEFIHANIPFVDSKVTNETRIPRSQDNLLFKWNSLFFANSRIFEVHQILNHKVGVAADSPAHPSTPILTANGLSRRIYNRNLRKIEKIELSGREDSFGPQSSEMGLDTIHEQKTGFPFFEKESRQPLPIGKKPSAQNAIVGIESPEEFSKKRYAGYKRSERLFLEYFTKNSQQYPEIINEIGGGGYEKILTLSVEKQTKNLQSTLKFNYFLNLEPKSSGQALTREFNWLTTLGRNVAIVSQLNRQEINRSESSFFFPAFHAAIRPDSRAPKCAKICKISYTFKYLKVPKPTSGFTRTTNYLIANYHSSYPHAADGYIAHNQKFDNKKGLMREKQYPIQVNKLHIMLDQQTFLKSLEIVTYRLIRAEALLCSCRKNVFQKAKPAANSLAYPSIPILVVSDLSQKIHNEILRKIEEPKFPDRGFLLLGGVPTKRSGTGTTGIGTAFKLLELLIRLFNPESLRRKFRVRKMAVESSQIKRYSVSMRSKKVIWEKKNLIERGEKPDLKESREKQDLRELIDSMSWKLVTESYKQIDSSQIWKNKTDVPVILDLINNNQTLLDSRRSQNISLSSSIEFMIQTFMKKYFFFLYWKYSSRSENNAMERKIIQEQKTGIFIFSKEEHRKAFPVGGMFAVKKAIRGEKTPVKFSKKFVIFLKAFSQEDVPGFNNLHIRRTSELFTLIGNKLLISNDEIITVRVANHELISRDYQSERSIGYERSERVTCGSHTNAYRKLPRAIPELRTKFFEKILIPLVEKQKSLQSALKLKSSSNLESKSSGSTITRTYDCLKTFPYSILLASQTNMSETYKPESMFFTPGFHAANKSISRVLALVSSIQRVLLDRNKPTYTIGTYTIDFPANIVRERKYPFRDAWLQKTFEFTDSRESSIKAIVEDENYFKKISVLRVYNDIATCVPEQSVVQGLRLTAVWMFNNLAALKSNLIEKKTSNYSMVHSTDIKNICSYRLQAFRALNYMGTRTCPSLSGYPADRKPTSKTIHITHYLIGNYQLSDHHESDYYKTIIQKVENERELKTKKEYSVRRNKLQSKTAQPISLRFLEAIIYRFKKVVAFPYSEIQNFTSDYTATRISSLQETNIFSPIFSPRQKLTLLTTSAYRGICQTTETLNYSTTSSQSYPAFLTSIYEKDYPFNYSKTTPDNLNAGMINYLPISNYIQGKELHSSIILNNYNLEKRTLSGKKTGLTFSSLSLSFPIMGTYTALSKKGILKYFSILDSPSEVNTTAVAEYFITSKIRKSFLEDRFLPNGPFSGRYLNVSVPLISEINGTFSGQKTIQVYGPSRYSAHIIPQNPISARISGALSDAETESLNVGNKKDKTASTSHFNKKRKLNWQKFSCWKTAVIILSRKGGKGEYANQNYSLQKSSAKSHITPGIFSEFILLARPDFTLGIKWKKILPTTSAPEKKTENVKDVLNGILLRFTALQSSEWTEKPRVYPEKRKTLFAFPMAEEAGKSTEIVPFETKKKNDFSQIVSLSQISRENLSKNGHIGLWDPQNLAHPLRKLGLLSRIHGILDKKVHDKENIEFLGTVALNGQKSTSYGTFFPLKNIDLLYASSYEGAVIGPVEVKDKGRAFTEKEKEMALRKPVTYVSKEIPGHIEENGLENIPKETTRYLPEENISYSISPSEINTIIDSVYRLLEAKLLIEKERRGLR